MEAAEEWSIRLVEDAQDCPPHSVGSLAVDKREPFFVRTIDGSRPGRSARLPNRAAATANIHRRVGSHQVAEPCCTVLMVPG